MTKTPPVDAIPKSGHKSPQSSTAPKADRLTVTLPTIRPPAAVLKLINPDPGRKLMDATEAMADEVLPAIRADHHLQHMLLRVRNLVIEGEGYIAMSERKLVNNHIAQIVVHYFERKKIRRVSVEARHHVGPSRTTVFVSVFHGRSEATRILEIT
jgi:hypothetical protein